MKIKNKINKLQEKWSNYYYSYNYDPLIIMVLYEETYHTQICHVSWY